MALFKFTLLYIPIEGYILITNYLLNKFQHISIIKKNIKTLLNYLCFCEYNIKKELLKNFVYNLLVI